MQNRRVIILLASLLMLIGTACAPQTAPVVTQEVIEIVTEEVLPTEAATVTPFVVRTLPPTWTPSPEADSAVSVEESDGSNPAATVPAAPEEAAPVFAPEAALTVCENFGEDRELNNRTFTPGAPVQVFWTPVEGAASYFITLIDGFGDTVQTDYTIEPTVLYAPELFDPNGLYGWEAYPIDAAGRQMCISRGAELVAANRPGG